MLTEWLDQCLRMAGKKADFYSGARKILRDRSFTFHSLGDELKLHHAGYTEMKRRALIKLYYHEEAVKAAVALWDRRVAQDKYGSVGFHCYNHFTKSDPTKGSKRASVMGPCIQSVSLTYLPDRTAAISCHYRTTELFKKFPADLVFLRDNLLAQFNFSKAPISEITFKFDNVTCHPMYFAVLLAWLDDPVAELNRLKMNDPYFHDWVVKWSARYLCDEHKRGIQKFAQAMRVHDEVRKDLKEAGMLRAMAKYMRDNHPGHRNAYVDPDNEDE